VDLPLPVAASTITTPKDTDSATISVLFWQSKENEISGHTATVDGRNPGFTC